MPVFSSHLCEYTELDLGQRIREERQARKLTLGDVSRAVGLSIARLSQIENALVVPDVSALIRIAAALGVSAQALLPEERSFPYQITRDVEVRSLPPRRARLRSDSGKLGQSHDFWPLADLFVGRHIEPLLGRIGNTAESDIRYYYHDELEFAFVLKGEMEFRIRTPDGEFAELLHGGDCVMFRADLPHLVRSTSPDPVESLHVFSGPSKPISTASDWFSPHVRGFFTEGESRQQDTAGYKLHLMREARGWTLEETAELAGLKGRQLEQIEKGNRPIPLDALMALTKAFGEPLRGFFSHLEDAPPYFVVRRAAEIRSMPRRRNHGRPERAGAANTYYPLASEFPSRSVFPYIIEVDATARHPAPSEHHGEEFIYVLEGQLELTTFAEDKEVHEILRAGDSCFLDSSVPHALRGETRNPLSDTSATVLDVFWCPLGEGYLFGSDPKEECAR